MREAVLTDPAPASSLRVPVAIALVLATAAFAWIASPSEPPAPAERFATVNVAAPPASASSKNIEAPKPMTAPANAVVTNAPAVEPDPEIAEEDDPLPEAPPAPAAAVVQAHRVSGARVGVEATSRRIARSSRTEWKAAAKKGDYKRALDAAVALDFEALTRSLGPADLKRLADVARYAKDPKRARKALEALRARHPKSKDARLAAFLLGKLATAGRDRRKAEAWFRTYLRESPRGKMVAECRGRIMELRKLRGDRASAAEAARDYLAHHPKGSYAHVAHAILAR